MLLQNGAATVLPLDPRVPGEESLDVDELPDAPVAPLAPPPAAALPLPIQHVRSCFTNCFTNCFLFALGPLLCSDSWSL